MLGNCDRFVVYCWFILWLLADLGGTWSWDWVSLSSTAIVPWGALVGIVWGADVEDDGCDIASFASFDTPGDVFREVVGWVEICALMVDLFIMDFLTSRSLDGM